MCRVTMRKGPAPIALAAWKHAAQAHAVASRVVVVHPYAEQPRDQEQCPDELVQLVAHQGVARQHEHQTIGDRVREQQLLDRAASIRRRSQPTPGSGRIRSTISTRKTSSGSRS